MKKLVLMISLIFVNMILLTACKNTAAGFGEDMQSNGKAIEKSVNSSS